jgi:hypothetical protein
MNRYDDDYDYDYRDISSDIDDLYAEAEIDDNHNEDEPWMDMEEKHTNHSSWDNYYHNITDELIDD